MTSRVSQTFILTLMMMLSSCASHPAFHAEKFRTEYETALAHKDLQFFQRLFSRNYWVGNQYRNRDEALAALANTFNEYSELQAEFTIQSVKFLPGGRTFIMKASLDLRGRHSGGRDQPWLPINEVTGSAIYVLEDGDWRLYKTVEKSLDTPL